MTESTESDPPRWNLIQFGLLCFYTMGFSGMTSIPYYIHRHTGLFLVAYYLLGILVCVPVCYVQLKLGALYKRGMLGIFSHLVPILKGVAVALLLMTYIRSLTHGLEMSYGLYFMFSSFKQPFPWSNPIKPNMSFPDPKTIYVLDTHEDHYFDKQFLQRSEYIGSFGPVVWYIMLCVLATWIIIFLFVFRGTKGIGKILYVLTPLTVICLVTILIYAYSAVPNACRSLYYMFSGTTSRHDTLTNKFHEKNVFYNQLGDPKLWIDALDIHLFSLGLWAGILPTLGTHIHNKKVIINAAWGILLALYSVVPHLVFLAIAPYIDPSENSRWLANAKGVKPGLSFMFVTIPLTFDKFSLSPFIAFLIYLTYFLLGLHHLGLHTLMIWENMLPCINKRVMMFFKRPDFLLALFCFVSFILTLPYTSQCGIYLYMIIRFYMDRLLFALVIFSMVPFIIGYIRQETLRLPIERLSMSLWYGLASLVAACLLIYYFAVYVYQESVVSVEQRWAEYLGWLASISPIIFGVILGAAHAVWKETGSLKGRFLQALRTGQLPDDVMDDEYTSVETGDTSMPQAKSPLPSEHQPHERPVMVSNELVQPKSEVEVSIKPPEYGDVVRV
ncbi:sodium- and chloride-dependent transporter XTRP3-like [Haliotis rubra]|uniref:sodium- and chloride-dependent transporter XTRP3-like n=1 Tax=Haliotis rubra TaxID=36100 RepID=UPI001EE62DE1|nr:sodium- and chloride-dependent transporter XTRP3-like [Haliotis rubra]